MKCDFVRTLEFCFLCLAPSCHRASLLPLHIMFILCKTVPNLLFPLWSGLLVHLPFSFIFITFSEILITFIPHCYLHYNLSLNTTAIHSWETKGRCHIYCLLLQMGGTAHQGRSSNLWKLQGSALDPNEGPHTAAAVPRESPVYAVQPVNRGEVPRILGEHATHACTVPNTGSP